jgi:hypothetical protein
VLRYDYDTPTTDADDGHGRIGEAAIPHTYIIKVEYKSTNINHVEERMAGKDSEKRYGGKRYGRKRYGGKKDTAWPARKDMAGKRYGVAGRRAKRHGGKKYVERFGMAGAKRLNMAGKETRKDLAWPAR